MPERLIDANMMHEALIRTREARKGHPEDVAVCNCALIMLDKMPTVDAVRVVHGRWNKINREKTGLTDEWRCNECGWPVKSKSPYCPNCGCDMREDVDGKK